jgi:hypothetical protein
VAIAQRSLNEPANLDYYVAVMARAKGIAQAIEAVQGYLESWPKERIDNVQKIDGGWAPFDDAQQAQPVYSAATVHCIRDSVHGHCMALRDAGMALTPELVELDEFFYAASRMLDRYGEVALQWRTRDRTPAIPTYADAFANW